MPTAPYLHGVPTTDQLRRRTEEVLSEVRVAADNLAAMSDRLAELVTELRQENGDVDR